MSERDEFEAWFLKRKEYGTELAFEAWKESRRHVISDPVAWMREDGKDKRAATDFCTDAVKRIWLEINPRQVERYTIPLYAAPQAMPALTALRRLVRAVELVDLCYEDAGSCLSAALDEQSAAFTEACAVLASAPQPSPESKD